MKEYVMGCINQRIDAQAQMASDARRLGYEDEARLYVFVERELQDLKREIEHGYPNSIPATHF